MCNFLSAVLVRDTSTNNVSVLTHSTSDSHAVIIKAYPRTFADVDDNNFASIEILADKIIIDEGTKPYWAIDYVRQYTEQLFELRTKIDNKRNGTKLLQGLFSRKPKTIAKKIMQQHPNLGATQIAHLITAKRESRKRLNEPPPDLRRTLLCSALQKSFPLSIAKMLKYYTQVFKRYHYAPTMVRLADQLTQHGKIEINEIRRWKKWRPTGYSIYYDPLECLLNK